jgi:hypothetical protein
VDRPTWRLTRERQAPSTSDPPNGARHRTGHTWVSISGAPLSWEPWSVLYVYLLTINNLIIPTTTVEYRVISYSVTSPTHTVITAGSYITVIVDGFIIMNVVSFILIIICNISNTVGPVSHDPTHVTLRIYDCVIKIKYTEYIAMVDTMIIISPTPISETKTSDENINIRNSLCGVPRSVNTTCCIEYEIPDIVQDLRRTGLTQTCPLNPNSPVKGPGGNNVGPW